MLKSGIFPADECELSHHHGKVLVGTLSTPVGKEVQLVQRLQSPNFPSKTASSGHYLWRYLSDAKWVTLANSHTSTSQQGKYLTFDKTYIRQREKFRQS